MVQQEKSALIYFDNPTNKCFQSLQQTEIDDLIKLSKAQKNCTILAKRVIEVFTSPEVLSVSFLPQIPNLILNSKDPVIDFTALQNAFDTLEEVKTQQMKQDPKQEIKQQIVIKKFRMNAQQTQNCPNPSFFPIDKNELGLRKIKQREYQLSGHEMAYNLTVFQRNLHKSIDSYINFDKKQYLKAVRKEQNHVYREFNFFYIVKNNWLRCIEKEDFERIIFDVHNVLTLEILLSNQQKLYRIQDKNFIQKFQHLYEMIEILFRANQQSRQLTVSKFYNPHLIELDHNQQELKQHYVNTLKYPQNFSLCYYPIVLPLEYQYDLLNLATSLKQFNASRKNLTNMYFNSQNFIPKFQLEIVVDRNNIVQDTLNQLNKNQDCLMLPLTVRFVGESGKDDGGLSKQFFQLIISKLFDLNYGMFLQKENYFWFNPEDDEMPIRIELIGSLIGISLYNAIQMQLRFPPVIYQILLQEPCNLEDLIEIEPEFGKFLLNLKEMDPDTVADVGINFEITLKSCLGYSYMVSLKQNGDKIPVTGDNRDEFIALTIDYFLNQSIEKQLINFQKGFYRVVQKDIIRMFSSQELMISVVGYDHLNMEELMQFTKYETPYTRNHPTIKFFWEIVLAFSQTEKQQFMAFCTGSQRAPIRGLKSLNLVIMRQGANSENLPSAQTCFNYVLLPEYNNKEKFQKKLKLAIENCIGFYIV